jgi:periplasmic mercuric ion binding protein
MKYHIVLLVSLGLLVPACRPKQPLETTTIKANSMVCGTCAKTIEKAVYAVEGVKEVNVDVKEKKVEVKFVSAQTNVETIEQAISDAGYDANNRKRNPDAYEKLQACCKIDG